MILMKIKQQWANKELYPDLFSAANPSHQEKWLREIGFLYRAYKHWEVTMTEMSFFAVPVYDRRHTTASLSYLHRLFYLF